MPKKITKKTEEVNEVRVESVQIEDSGLCSTCTGTGRVSDTPVATKECPVCIGTGLSTNKL